MVDPKQSYSILGVRESDDFDTIHRIRNLWLLRYHPDKKDSYSKERFDSINEAYEIICSNINEIRKESKSENSIFRRINLILYVDIEDIYFKKELYIVYSRRVYCKDCEGTGSMIKDLIKSKCNYCYGKGSLENNIAYQTFFDKKSCNICNGTGIKKEYLCKACSGLKYYTEIKTIPFILDIKDYHRRYKKFVGKGDQLGKDKFGDVVVSLKIKENNTIRIDKNIFVVKKEVTPVQIIVGGKSSVNIFNRNVEFKIKRKSLFSFCFDKINKDNRRKVKVEHIVKYPDMTEETKPLYEKILELEIERNVNV